MQMGMEMQAATAVGDVIIKVQPGRPERMV